MAIDDAGDRHEARPQAMDMAGLGPLTLLVIGLFSLMFSGPNYAYAVGHIGGRLISAFILALPVYVIYRYATKAGRSMAIKRLVNIFCLLVAAIWVLLAALSAAMPGMMESLTRKQSAAELGYSAAQSQPERRNSDGAKPGMFDDLIPAHGQASGDHAAPSGPGAKTDWSQFTPTAPSTAKPGYDTRTVSAPAQASTVARKEDDRTRLTPPKQNESARLDQEPTILDAVLAKRSLEQAEIDLAAPRKTSKRRTDGPNDAGASSEATQAESMRRLALMHPDWQDVDNDPAFAAFNVAQGSEYMKRLMKASLAYDYRAIGEAISRFKASRRSVAASAP